MTASSKDLSGPTFNLKVVERKTGIKSHTLRSWEDRYDLPKPIRTDGGHRRYTLHDLDVIRWLSARLREGMKISRAVELWRSIEAAGEDPFMSKNLPIDEHILTQEMDTALEKLRENWIASCLKFDEAQANRILVQAFSLYPTSVVCIEILQKGLAHIGQMWFRNQATVQQEHFTSSYVVRRLDALIAAAPLPTKLGRILIACPTYEEHTIPLLLLSLLLLHQGWHVVYLGASVPESRLDSTVDVIKPDLVVLAAHQLRTAASLRSMAKLLSNSGIRVAYGGLIFVNEPSAQKHIQGMYLGNSLAESVTLINQIMLSGEAPNLPDQIPEAYYKAAQDYRLHQALIEWDVRWLLEIEGIPYEQLAATNARLADAIVAALELGDLNLANNEVDYGMDLMRSYGVSMQWRRKYFTAYYRAAYKHLKEESTIILEWLNEVRRRFSEEGTVEAEALGPAY